MIELQRHIEILLLENECVIVPDFGGFMTHRVAARYDSEDHQLLPPYRTLGFNPQLNMNDSILVQSYVEAYDISYPEALRRIEAEVSELKQQLSEQGEYEMENLGTLTINAEGNYEFAPCEAGVLSPELYGLSSFPFKRLHEDAGQETPAAEVVAASPVTDAAQAPLQPTLLDFTESENDNTIAIKMSWVRNAIAVAAAVVAFFLIATPVANSDLGSQTVSNLQGNILYKLMPKDSNTVPMAQPVDTVKAVATAPKVAVAKPEDIKQGDIYYIIVASQVRKSNAEALAAKLNADGYQDAKVFIHNNIVRVTCGEFSSEAEAYRQLSKMHHLDEFAEAWVYKKKAEV